MLNGDIGINIVAVLDSYRLLEIKNDIKGSVVTDNIDSCCSRVCCLVLKAIAWDLILCVRLDLSKVEHLAVGCINTAKDTVFLSVIRDRIAGGGHSAVCIGNKVVKIHMRLWLVFRVDLIQRPADDIILAEGLRILALGIDIAEDIIITESLVLKRSKVFASIVVNIYVN